MNLLIYLRFDDVTERATGAVLCSLPPPEFSHKMVPLPFKMVVHENKVDAAGFLCAGAMGPPGSFDDDNCG